MTREPTVEAHPERDGVRIVDPVERAREDLLTPEPVDPSPCGTGSFCFPVDVGFVVETDRIRVPYVVDLFVRDADGDLVAETCNKGSVEVPPGEYNVDLSVAGVKLYLAVESGLRAGNVDDRTEVRFDGERRVELGVRSYHERPAGTVTVTDEPEDVMAGLSLFGSALKTTSPERSFPNLRGHPPLLELGDGFDAPDHLERPDVDVRIEVPPEPETVFPTASLAYYLGAAVVPGDRPRLVAGGESHDLSGSDSGAFGESVGRVLKQQFLLDCVTRTEGYFDVELAERNRVESLADVELNFAELYDAPLSERVNRYLDVSPDVVREVLPRWRLTVDVGPDPENAVALPYFATKLARIRRTERSTPGSPTPPQPDSISDFYRVPPAREEGRTDGGISRRGVVDRQELNVVWPEPTESFEHVWLDEGVALGANKTSVDALRRRVKRSPVSSPTVDVTVVINDRAMEAESIVEQVYDGRDHSVVEVTVKRGVGASELAELISEDRDFLHFIGHINQNGLQCPGGSLDVGNVSEVRVDSFLLNGCVSFDQGKRLIEKGAIGGIVTLDEVSNAKATEMGSSLAMMLASGHSLSTAARFLDQYLSTGSRYFIVGDGTKQLLVPWEGSSTKVRISESTNGWDAEISIFPSDDHQMGSLYIPHISDANTRHLNIGRIEVGDLTDDELKDYLDRTKYPVLHNGQMYIGEELIEDLDIGET